MNDQNPTTGRSEKLRSAATLRLLVAGGVLLVAMLIQLMTSVTDWSALGTDPTGFVTGHALALIGVVGGIALVLVGLVRGLCR